MIKFRLDVADIEKKKIPANVDVVDKVTLMAILRYVDLFDTHSIHRLANENGDTPTTYDEMLDAIFAVISNDMHYRYGNGVSARIGMESIFKISMTVTRILDLYQYDARTCLDMAKEYLLNCSVLSTHGIAGIE